MKKTHRENFRVEVYPRQPWLATEGAMERLCEEIKIGIKRHVDDVGQIYVEYDVVSTCEHCGSRWTEESTTYNGGCCDKDEANNPNPEEIS